MIRKKIIPTTEAEVEDATPELITTDLITVEETTVKPKQSYDANANLYKKSYLSSKFIRDGEYDDSSGYTFTYYSETVLPGPGLKIPGRHVDDEGYVCDKDGNICLAAKTLPKGTVVKIPFGNGIGVVYDECITDREEDIIDIYLNSEHIKRL